MLKKTKRQLLGRNSWAENSVSLDLIERSLTFCPGTNMTAIKGSRLPWDSFEYQLLDRCVEAGCDGKFDLCCPYVDPGTYGLIKVSEGEVTANLTSAVLIPNPELTDLSRRVR